MTIIAVPASLRFSDIDWDLARPAQVNRPAYRPTKPQIVANPWYGQWTASGVHVSVVGEANFLASRGFFLSLRGQVNTFRLRATETAQTSSTAVTVNGAHSAAVTSLSTAGWPASTTVLKVGHLFTVNDQLCGLTQDAVSSAGGVATLVFEPPLRAATAGGTAVEVRYPTCLVALTTPSIRWSVGKGQVYSASIDVEERE